MASDPNLEGRLRTALSDRYAIEREIGLGGMATVYLAKDLKHNRLVAVKVLDPELAVTLGAERFLREIETAASLTHPHILPLFDSGEADGFLFYVMPYMRGESLRARLTKERQLPVEDAVQFTSEIADALAYAHGQGIVHRDVKPANIMLEAGHAVLADFGVAHAVSEAKDQRLTRTGTSLGTPAYMSPEQATGEQHLDGRSDQYALGCVLFEMLAGHPPFTGVQADAVIRQHLTQDPPSITGARPAVTAEIAGVIRRSLAKSPADRFKTTAEMAAALELRTSGGQSFSMRFSRIGLVTTALVVFLAGYLAFFREEPTPVLPTQDQRVAVLPIENLTGDPSLDRIGCLAADWISEGLVNTGLVKTVPFTEIYASSQANSGSGNGSPPLSQSWPEETGANLAVLGSFSSVGDSIQFRLRMVDREGTVVRVVTPASGHRDDLSETLGRLQVVVATAIAAQVAPGSNLAWSAIGGEPPNPEAHELFLEGMGLVGFDNAEAIKIFQRALAIDPGYFNPLISQVPAFFNLRKWVEADSVCQVAQDPSNHYDQQQRLWTQANCAEVPAGRIRAFRELTGDLYMSWYQIALNGTRANLPRETLDACTQWDPDLSRQTRSWTPSMWRRCMMALHMVGDYEGELSFLRAKEEEHDRTWPPEETEALIALGRFDEARGSVEERLNALTPGGSPVSILDTSAREFAAHGQPEMAADLWSRALDWLSSQPSGMLTEPENMRARAEMLLFLDRNEEAMELLSELVAENPQDVGDLGRLGVARAKLGDRSGALELSEALIAIDIPFQRGERTSWRAAIAANLGDSDEALRLLDQAITEGWYVYLNLHRSPYLKPLRDYGPFKQHFLTY